MMDKEGFERIAITVAEAAWMVGLGEPAIYRLVGRGEIEARRLGGRILILYQPFKKKFGL